MESKGSRLGLPTVQETQTKQNQEPIEWKSFPHPFFTLPLCNGQIGKKGEELHLSAPVNTLPHP